MADYTKQFYSIGEVSQMLEVPIYTLRYWETEFPMFKPNRTAKGTRRYTPEDLRLATRIKELLYDRGLKIDGAIEYLNKSYRTCPPRRQRVCRNYQDALTLLGEVRLVVDDAHIEAKIASVEEWIKSQQMSQ
ncbi:MAG: MerR family transcriptional regulator [Muribaculaceae bacterium]|nr:MerR family transcriptional regulator [Muribaculaceae bacterium]